MFEKVKELLVDKLGVDEDQVTLEASFTDDLDADSLDMFDLVMELEEIYDIKIPTEELENLKTVGDVVKYIEDHK